MNHWVCAIKSTLQLAKVHTNSVTLCPWESLEYLNQFQCIPHNTLTTYNSSYVCSEKHLTTIPQKPMAMQFPQKSQKRKGLETKV